MIKINNNWQNYCFKGVGAQDGRSGSKGAPGILTKRSMVKGMRLRRAKGD